jgi:TM2 domain-containing membrane protein YozV
MAVAEPARSSLNQSPDHSFGKATLIEARVANEKKSTGLAYVLWFFLGGLGVHNFYLRRPLLALVEVACVWIGVIGAFAAPPLALLAILGGILLFIDLFTIPGAVRRDMERIRTRVAAQI